MIIAFILISVNPGTERKVYGGLKKIPEVSFIYELYGEWDLIVMIEIDDMKKLDSLVSDNIRILKDVKLTSTMIVAR